MKKKVIRSNEIPVNSIIARGFTHIHYCDSYRADLSQHPEETVDGLINKLFRIPGWVVFLMKIRNTLMKPLGLKTDFDFSDRKPRNYYTVGKRAVYFKVIDRNEQEIVMAEKDTHLNFRTSVFVEENSQVRYAWLTTLVHYNNSFGRLYFIPVKPFHRIIIKSLMRKLSDTK